MKNVSVTLSSSPTSMDSRWMAGEAGQHRFDFQWHSGIDAQRSAGGLADVPFADLLNLLLGQDHEQRVDALRVHLAVVADGGVTSDLRRQPLGLGRGFLRTGASGTFLLVLRHRRCCFFLLVLEFLADESKSSSASSHASPSRAAAGAGGAAARGCGWEIVRGPTAGLCSTTVSCPGDRRDPRRARATARPEVEIEVEIKG
jgi:hypothetical protein